MAESVSIRQPSKSEKRSSKRIPIEERIFFGLALNQTQGGVVHNVSESGAFLIASVPLPPMTTLRMTFSFSFGRKKKLCQLIARVVRRELVENSVFYGYGLHFEGSPKEALQTLQEFVFYKSTGKIPQRYESSQPGYQLQIPVRFVSKVPLARIKFREQSKPSHPLFKTPPQIVLKKSKSLKAAPPRPGYLVQTIVILAVATVGLILTYNQLVRPRTLAASLSDLVPMVEAHVDRDVFVAEVSSHWVLRTSDSQKKADLALLAKALREKSIYQAVLQDEAGHRVAYIMHNPSNKSAPGIRIEQ
jgi:hypothetical protein